VRRLALLIAAGSLWLFLAAVPAFADGGPHMSSVNSGVSSLTADSCAGCHRAHTAQGEGLLVQPSAEALCLGCHNATAIGAATDVMTGVQYIKSSITSPVVPDKSDDPKLGYLRDGGFQSAHLGTASAELIRVGYYRAKDTVSFRMKVPVDTAVEATTSAHLDLVGNAAITGPAKIWGYGLANNAAPVVSMECVSCHNVHGNGQYRILNKLNSTDQLVQATAVPISSFKAQTNRIFTSEAHSLITGDIVTLSGVPAGIGLTDGIYIVKATAGNTFQVATTSATPTTADIANAVVDITADAAGTASSSVKRWAAIVDDAPLPAAGDTRNYTILQTKGTQGTNSTYMLYESNVLAAAGGVFNGINGDYSATGGDYFHRTVPWNPAFVTPSDNCNTFNYPTGVSVPASCATANDAPNGRPSTTTSQIAFNDQISAWCATCHTRYYSSTNTNPGIYSGNAGDLEPSSSADVSKTIASVSGNDMLSPAGATFGFAVGDIINFSNTGATEYYVVYSNTTGSGAAAVQTIRVSTSLDGVVVAAPGVAAGTAIRLYPFSSSSWYFERNSADTQYKFQHQTTTNRACTTCHVGHGTDAVMTVVTGGDNFSANVPWPDGSAVNTAYNSRLLKIDNRGTCQACHDPTGTATAGTQYPVGSVIVPTVP
jgi:predicted CXXCH cytochrome family protein